MFENNENSNQVNDNVTTTTTNINKNAYENELNVRRSNNITFLILIEH